MRGIGLLILSILCKLLRIRVRFSLAGGGLVAGLARLGGRRWSARRRRAAGGGGIWAQKSPEVGASG